MNRDLVLVTVAFVLGSGGFWLAGWLPEAPVDGPLPEKSGALLEGRSWRRLWMMLLPAALAAATLIGWGLQEPAQTDEPLRPIAVLVAAPAALLWLRALCRACFALRTPRVVPALATVGILRPRIVMAEELPGALDARALAAALAHERAHARHHDPLRIWLAQLATDLQWPIPFASRRLERWLGALELARDEEARREGAPGVDLAAAIVGVAKLGKLRLPDRAGLAAMATLGGADRLFASRIHRLLRPLGPTDEAPAFVAVCVAVAVILMGGVLVGVRYGDAILRALPFIRS